MTGDDQGPLADDVLAARELGDYIGAAYVGAVHQARGERARGELAAMLERTREPVEAWTVELDLRTTGPGDDRGEGLHQAHLICCACRQSVLCLSKDLRYGVAVVTVAIVRAAVARHWREAHTDGGGDPV